MIFVDPPLVMQLIMLHWKFLLFIVATVTCQLINTIPASETSTKRPPPNDGNAQETSHTSSSGTLRLKEIPNYLAFNYLQRNSGGATQNQKSKQEKRYPTGWNQAMYNHQPYQSSPSLLSSNDVGLENAISNVNQAALAVDGDHRVPMNYYNEGFVADNGQNDQDLVEIKSSTTPLKAHIQITGTITQHQTANKQQQPSPPARQQPYFQRGVGGGFLGGRQPQMPTRVAGGLGFGSQPAGSIRPMQGRGILPNQIRQPFIGGVSTGSSQGGGLLMGANRAVLGGSRGNIRPMLNLSGVVGGSNPIVRQGSGRLIGGGGPRGLNSGTGQLIGNVAPTVGGQLLGPGLQQQQRIIGGGAGNALIGGGRGNGLIGAGAGNGLIGSGAGNGLIRPGAGNGLIGGGAGNGLIGGAGNGLIASRGSGMVLPSQGRGTFLGGRNFGSTVGGAGLSTGGLVGGIRPTMAGALGGQLGMGRGYGAGQPGLGIGRLGGMNSIYDYYTAGSLPIHRYQFYGHPMLLLFFLVTWIVIA